MRKPKLQFDIIFDSYLYYMKVRITAFSRSDESLLNILVPRYAFGEKKWKDIEFVIDDNYDWLVILTSPNVQMLEEGYDYKKTVTFLTEPPESPNRIAYPTSLISPMYLPQPFWPTNILTEIKHNSSVSLLKTKLLSSITSGRSGLVGHRKRLEFLYVFDKIVDEGLDIWGRDFNNPIFKELKNYKGSLDEKYNALWPYKYHFACENTFNKGYFTEKIIDPIICDCLCFYDGCQNIEEFIDERAFVKININNIDESIELIIKIIESEEWEKRITCIRSQKERFLYHLNPLNIIWMTLHGKDALKECKL